MKRPGPTLRVRLRETGSTTDIRLVPYMWLAGVSFSLFSWSSHFQWRARKGCLNMQLLDRCCGHKIRRYEAVLFTKAPSHVKHAKDKVEASNFILQGLCDMVKVGLLNCL